METIGWFGIAGRVLLQFLPVWVGLTLLFAVSFAFRRQLGFYGRFLDSWTGMLGFGIVVFWILTAILADLIQPFPELSQIAAMKNRIPGTPVPGSDGMYYLLGGDNLGRDVFSRMVAGSRRVLLIAPAATILAFMTGIMLGLPAGYFGGRYDAVLSFVANLVLSFPVILLFYLLVTPEIRDSGHEVIRMGGYSWRSSIPNILAALLFIFPVAFLAALVRSRYSHRPEKRHLLFALTLAIGIWLYLGLVFHADPTGILAMDPNLLNIFVAVVFVNSPSVFRIVRGLTMDIKARDYVAAAKTRGERPWYIMLWEILPNARGPLIVDFCLRVGYTTILLGTLGFFGLGVDPESPDWGMTINEGRKLLSIYPHPAIPPALALLSLVLGLNLLADGMREITRKR